MAKKNQAAAPAPATDEAQNTGTVEAVESAAPEGVETTEEAAAPAPEEISGTVEHRPDDSAPGVQIDGQGLPPAPGDLVAYAVQWHIKTGGRRYGPGEVAELTEEQAAPFLASGAIVAG